MLSPSPVANRSSLSLRLDTIPVLPQPIARIYSDEEFNYREAFGSEHVKELADTIAKEGLLAPILIRPYSGPLDYDFVVIAGHRRLAACKLLGMTEISAKVITDLTEEEALTINLLENLKRKDPNIMDDAFAVRRFHKMGLSFKQIAAKLGYTAVWAETRYMLTELPIEAQQGVKTGVISLDHIKHLYARRHDKNQQYSLIRMIYREREAGNKSKIELDLKKIAKKNARRQRSMSEVGAMQDVIREAFGNKNNLTTRFAGWVIGVVSTEDFYKDLKAEVGGDWEPPTDIPQNLIL